VGSSQNSNFTVGGADIAFYVCATQVRLELLRGADIKIDVGAARIGFL
jgi:hypothetical protein